MQKNLILNYAQTIDSNLEFLQEHVYKIFIHGSTKLSNRDLTKIEQTLRESQNLAKMIIGGCTKNTDTLESTPQAGVDFQDEM